VSFRRNDFDSCIFMLQVVNSLLSMSPSEVRALFCDPRGSRVADAWSSSASVGEKSRQALAKLLAPELPNLAKDKHGSRTVDALWRQGSIKVKEILAAGLAAATAALAADKYGCFLAATAHLNIFNRNRDAWRSAIEGVDKKQKVAEDLAEELGLEVKKAKKEKINIESEETLNLEVKKENEEEIENDFEKEFNVKIKEEAINEDKNEPKNEPKEMKKPKKRKRDRNEEKKETEETQMEDKSKNEKPKKKKKKSQTSSYLDDL